MAWGLILDICVSLLPVKYPCISESGAKMCVRKREAVICSSGPRSPSMPQLCVVAGVWSKGDMLSVWLWFLLPTRHVRYLGCRVQLLICRLSFLRVQKPRTCLCEYVCLCHTGRFCKTSHLGCVLRVHYICASGSLLIWVFPEESCHFHFCQILAAANIC